jgi:sulfopyruvate decarboxylase subunit alpha
MGTDPFRTSRSPQTMPVSARNSSLIYDSLKACGVRIMSALPETWLVHLIRLADEDDDMILVRLAKEEEGVGISMGAHLAGVQSAMLMQNHGFLASVNGIVSGAQLFRIPLLMLISHRGEFGERDPWQTEGGGVTEHVLSALRIPFTYLETQEHVTHRVRKAQTLASASNKPVALLLTRDLMWEESSR